MTWRMKLRALSSDICFHYCPEFCIARAWKGRFGCNLESAVMLERDRTQHVREYPFEMATHRLRLELSALGVYIYTRVRATYLILRITSCIQLDK